jgi:hypothetical protein
LRSDAEAATRCPCFGARKELWATPVAGRNDQNKLLGDGQSASFHYDTAGLEEAERAAQVPIAFAVVADASTNEYLTPYPRS